MSTPPPGDPTGQAEAFVAWLTRQKKHGDWTIDPIVRPEIDEAAAEPDAAGRIRGDSRCGAAS